jgi:hypothetical protein
MVAAISVLRRALIINGSSTDTIVSTTPSSTGGSEARSIVECPLNGPINGGPRGRDKELGWSEN